MIYLEEGEFFASVNVPYAAELKEAGWRKRMGRWVTKDIARVIDFADHLHPDIIESLTKGADDYSKSTALVATEGFTPMHPTECVLTGKALKLYQFQSVDVEFILAHKDTLLAEDCGTGKSAIISVAANMLDPKRILLICPAVAKYNWLKKEWPRWSTLKLSVGVAEGDYWPDTDVVIINYDILDRHKARIQAVDWDLCICDECHRIKNRDARRTKMVIGGNLKLKDTKKATAAEQAAMLAAVPARKKGHYKVAPIRAKRRIWASATPMNRPKDLWVVCHEFDPTGLGKDWMKFHRRYCQLTHTPFGMQINGSDNLEELGILMRKAFMVRHNAAEVLDLPPFRENMFLLPPVEVVMCEEEEFITSNLDLLMRLSEKMGKPLTAQAPQREFMKLIGDAVVNNVKQIGEPAFVPLFSKFAMIREQTGIAKLPNIINYIREKTEELEIPVVVFGYHKAVMAELREAFPDSAFIVGGMSSEKRHDEEVKFQEGKVNILLGNIDAAGEAITLTRSNYLIFAELDWRGTALIQARKRIHRISQTRPCTVDYLCAADSFDHLLAEKALSKMEDIKETLDL